MKLTAPQERTLKLLFNCKDHKAKHTNMPTGCDMRAANSLVAKGLLDPIKTDKGLYVQVNKEGEAFVRRLVFNNVEVPAIEGVTVTIEKTRS